ncbi:hypothetical protein ACFOWE_32785 [Planomonospora corallina]|uniref:Protein kinase domain-containing protein n=1 Tax=Planomonospora corallina TaxID=1806052 RepID=A0ABV8IGP4_9ACTN
MRIVRESALGRLTYIAEGAFARVHRVEGYTLPGDPTPLAYKRFTTKIRQQARTAEAVVRFRDTLPDADRADLDAYSVWPRALVTSRMGRVCGLLMPLIPQDFFCELNDPKTGNRTSRPREMDWLISTTAQRAAAQIDLADVERSERLMLLAQLVYFIGRLHKHGWVFGDISFRNAAFALDPPRLLLLDCDGAAPLTDLYRRQASTPHWEPPECSPQSPRRRQLQDDVTDVYKLGLAILRCLAPGKGAGSSRSAGRFTSDAIDDAGRDLVERALSPDRSVRPTAKDLYVHLSRSVASRVKTSHLSFARLASPCVIRGQDAVIEWEIENATEAVISYGNGSRTTVDLTAHPRRHAFRPDASGPVSVEVRNKYGGLRVDLGSLTLFELPGFHFDPGELPRPKTPRLEAFQAPIMSAVLKGRPRIATGGEVVEMPRLRAFEFIGSLVPADRASVFAPGFNGIVADTVRTVRDSLEQAGGELKTAIRRIHEDRLGRLERERTGP